jgi:hypothetical protein
MICCDLICTDVSDQPAAFTFIVNLDMVVRILAIQRIVYPVMDHLAPPHFLILGYAISNQGMFDFKLPPRSRLELRFFEILHSE